MIYFLDCILMFIFSHSNTRNWNTHDCVFTDIARSIMTSAISLFPFPDGRSFVLMWKIITSGFSPRTGFTWSSRHLIVVPWHGLTKIPFMSPTINTCFSPDSALYVLSLLIFFLDKIDVYILYLFFNNVLVVLRRYDTIKTCRWNFFKFSWVVHYRKIKKDWV